MRRSIISLSEYQLPMRSAQIINEFIKSQNYRSLMQTKEIEEHGVRDIIKEYFPKIGLTDKLNLATFLSDEELYDKLQRMFEAHQELFSRIQSIQQQINIKSRVNAEDSVIGTGKKVTRAALARRHEKNQEQIRKDQIFVRLTPKSQSCIQFMLCNRNFPRMECKLSCNQHLEYLVNYLTNKWIRGKVGYKIVLYPDNSFLKSMPLSEKEKSLKEPLNNYLMFTDIMTCCGVHQNGILNLSYQIVEIKKMTKPTSVEVNSNAENLSVEISQSQPVHIQPVNHKVNSSKQKNKQISANLPELTSPLKEKVSKSEDKQQSHPLKIITPSKNSSKDEYIKEASIFNRNSNFFNSNNEESLFGSLGFNFNFGVTPAKRDDHLLSINSLNYLDLHEIKKMREDRQQVDHKQAKIELKDEKVDEVNEEPSQKSNGVQLKKENNQQRQNLEIRPSKQEIMPQDIKLGTLMSFLQQMEKEKPVNPLSLPGPQQEAQNNNSNKIKDVKLVNIVKKRTANN